MNVLQLVYVIKSEDNSFETGSEFCNNFDEIRNYLNGLDNVVMFKIFKQMDVTQNYLDDRG